MLGVEGQYQLVIEGLQAKANGEALPYRVGSWVESREFLTQRKAVGPVVYIKLWWQIVVVMADSQIDDGSST